MTNSLQSIKNTLSELPVGESAIVTEIHGNNPVSKRLMEMGIVPGVSIKVIKTAPWGCPLQISVRGYHLAIRRSEADTIAINK